ncbi:MFS transporter [Carnimonas bestiolae]|uniref:MFS transporter n=1 Tax=Carnimonas bestiolae TaxID=3402172 RepID=UPI003EDB9EC8
MNDSMIPPSADGSARDSVFKKVAWRIMPILLIGYIIAYLDRVNISFAKLQMSHDIGLSDTAYGLGAGLFFIGYFFFEVPSNMMMHRIGAKAWIARIMISWGVISALFAFVQNDWQFYTLRFLLGVAEAGFYPGIILYLTYWFPSQRRAKMFALFQIGSPIAGIIGNPISGAIMYQFADWGSLANWQWLFLIEAVPAFVLGVIIIRVLDNSVKDAKWLSAQERTIVEEEIEQDRQHTIGHSGFLKLLKNPDIWLMSLIYFSFVMGQYGLTLWMPSLIQRSGVESNLAIGLLSAIPFICAVIMMVFTSRSADKHRERRWHLIGAAIVAAVGFVVAASASSVVISIIALSLAMAGVLSCAPMFWSLPTAVLSSASAAAGLAMINSLANLAGFVSPYMIGALQDWTQSSAIGMYMLAAFMVFGAILVFTVPPHKVNR